MHGGPPRVGPEAWLVYDHIYPDLSRGESKQVYRSRPDAEADGPREPSGYQQNALRGTPLQGCGIVESLGNGKITMRVCFG